MIHTDTSRELNRPCGLRARLGHYEKYAPNNPDTQIIRQNLADVLKQKQGR